MRGTLISLNVSPGGIPKRPIERAQVSREGVEGDWQLNRKYHGGPDRAICLYSLELYDSLRADGVDLKSGDVGENFTLLGVDLQALAVGDRLKVGGCTIQITKVRVPCSTLKKWHSDLPRLIEGRSGWVARVIGEGEVAAGDLVETL